MANGPYSRVYWQLMEEYPEVYDSPRLADYVRLLVASEQAYPNRAFWRGVASAAAVRYLCAAGAGDARGPLMTLDGQRYEIRGLRKERASRSQTASHAAKARWANADGT